MLLIVYRTIEGNIIFNLITVTVIKIEPFTLPQYASSKLKVLLKQLLADDTLATLRKTRTAKVYVRETRRRVVCKWKDSKFTASSCSNVGRTCN